MTTTSETTGDPWNYWDERQHEMEHVLRALDVMGYREAERGKWWKPVGSHLFAFEGRTWTNACPSGRDGEVGIFSRREMDHAHARSAEKAVAFFVATEAWTRINIRDTEVTLALRMAARVGLGIL